MVKRYVRSAVLLTCPLPPLSLLGGKFLRRDIKASLSWIWIVTNALMSIAAEVADDEIILARDIKQVAALWAENKRANLWRAIAG